MYVDRDLRAQAPTWSYIESHSDDLTNLSFHPSQSHLLLSGSVDGLINTFDVRIEDEDEGLLATAQVGSSVLSCGWMDLDGSGSMGGVWGSTTIETVQTWKFENVSRAFPPWRDPAETNLRRTSLT